MKIPKITEEGPGIRRTTQIRSRWKATVEYMESCELAQQIGRTIDLYYPMPQSMRSSIMRAVVLIETGAAFDGSDLNTDMADLCKLREFEQLRVDQTGRCDGGCSDASLIESKISGTICRWTLKPCPAIALSDLVEAIGQINKPKGE